MRKGPVSRGRSPCSWNGGTPVWEVQRVKGGGWDEAGWQAQPGPAWLFGLVGFIPRVVGGPTGAGMQVVAG